MRQFLIIVCLFLLTLTATIQLPAQDNKLVTEAEQSMLKATKFMVEKAATNGGYVWYYMPDFSRKWGEMAGSTCKSSPSSS